MNSEAKIEQYLLQGMVRSFRNIYEYQQDDYCTHEDVLEALRGVDLVEAYNFWVQEQGETYWWPGR